LCKIALLDTPKNIETYKCPQCGVTSGSEVTYCPACGQKRIHGKVTLKDLLNSFLSDYLAYDSKLALSLKPLLFKPGFLTVEYLAGKRTGYITPFRLYIFISIFFFLLLNWHSTPKMEAGTVMGDELMWDTFFGNYLPKIFFLLLPIFALLTGWVFQRKNQGYVANLILALHFHAFVFLVLIAYLLISSFVISLGWGSVNSVALSAVGVWSAVYLYLKLKRVYGISHRALFWRYLLLLLLYIFVILVAVFVLLAVVTLRS